MTSERETLGYIIRQLDDALKADCEHGVDWLNKWAIRDYLLEYPATLAAIHNIRVAITAELDFGGSHEPIP